MEDELLGRWWEVEVADAFDLFFSSNSVVVDLFDVGLALLALTLGGAFCSSLISFC